MSNITKSEEPGGDACDQVVSRLRILGEMDPETDFADRVMARIGEVSLHNVPETMRRRVLRWLVSPRAIRISPLGGLAVAACLLLVLGLVFQAGRVEDILAPQKRSPVKFVLGAPGAREVAVIGSFNGWNAVGWSMRRDAATGLWTLSTVLPPGSHEYVFLVDGVTPLPDAAAALIVDDGFGSRNSVLVVKNDDGSPL